MLIMNNQERWPQYAFPRNSGHLTANQGEHFIKPIFESTYSIILRTRATAAIPVTVAYSLEGTGKAVWSRPCGFATRTQCLVLSKATPVPLYWKRRAAKNFRKSRLRLEFAESDVVWKSINLDTKEALPPILSS